MFNPLWPHGLCSPWDSLGQNTGGGYHAHLQGIFPTQESNPGLAHCRWILYQLSHEGSPGNQPWIFTGRTEAPILWLPDAKSWFTGKDPDAGKGWGQEVERETEDEMVGWHHDSMKMSLSKLWEIVKDREVWHAAVQGVTKHRSWLSEWTTTTKNRWSVCPPTGHSWEGEWRLWSKWRQWPWWGWKWMDFMNRFRGRGDRAFGIDFQCCIFYSTIMR